MTAVSGSLRATTHLADGANQLFEEWMRSLRSAGIDIAGSVGDDNALDADVVFACGLLTATRIRDGAPLRIVASPRLPGESDPVYRSVFIVRTDSAVESLAGSQACRIAVNEYGSWSGWHGAKEHLRSTGIRADCIGEHVITGGHVKSIAAVRDGHADVASIDHSVWYDFVSRRERADDLRVIETTRDWPAPPLSIRTTLPSALQQQLIDAMLSLPELVETDPTTYRFMLDEVEEHPTWP